MKEVIYFKPPGINPKYCEVGMIMKQDPEYIWYLNEPAKILIKDCIIIKKDNVIYNKKQNMYEIK